MWTSIAVGAMHVLEVLFFLGLAGCASAIVLSWIDILKDGFTDDPTPKISDSQ